MTAAAAVPRAWIRWTSVEDETIRVNYRLLGPKATAALLPGRGQRAVIDRAHRLGCNRQLAPVFRTHD
jgi:hypothetical protein